MLAKGRQVSRFCTLVGQGCLIPHPLRMVAGGLGVGRGCCWPLTHSRQEDAGRNSGSPRWPRTGQLARSPKRLRARWAWGLLSQEPGLWTANTGWRRGGRRGAYGRRTCGGWGWPVEHGKEADGGSPWTEAGPVPADTPWTCDQAVTAMAPRRRGHGVGGSGQWMAGRERPVGTWDPCQVQEERGGIWRRQRWPSHALGADSAPGALRRGRGQQGAVASRAPPLAPLLALESGPHAPIWPPGLHTALLLAETRTPVPTA